MSQVCSSSLLVLINKVHALTLQACDARSKNQCGYFCICFAPRAGGVEAVRVMEEESWRELGCPPLLHIIKENKYLSLACDSFSLRMRKIHATQRKNCVIKCY